MATFCELDEVVLQIRYKTQIFYETFKRDSIAEQLYNFSNDQDQQDPDTPYSKSLERDYSSIIFQHKQQQQQQQQTPGITVSPPPQPISKQDNVISNTSENHNTNQNNQNNHQSNNNGNNNQNNNTKTCKVVQFSGTSVKLNKNINNKEQKSIQYNNNQETTTEKNGIITTVTPTTTIVSDSTAPVFVFVKENISSHPTQQPQDSLLSRLVKPSNSDSQDEMFREYGEFTPIGENTRGILITCHAGIQSIGIIKVKVIDNATVIQTIAAVLKQHFINLKESNANNTSSSNSNTTSPSTSTTSTNTNSTTTGTLSPPSLSSSATSINSSTSSGNNATTQQLIPDPKAYNLRIADSLDGKIDEDYPTLDLNQLIYKFKSEVLVLCPNPKYEGHKKRSSSGTNNNNNNTNSGGTLHPGHKTHPQRGGSVGGSIGGDSPLVVKITLPDCSITKVAYQPEMKLKELLMNTIKKRKLIGENYHFTLENGVACNLNMTMLQLGSVDLVMASSNHRRSMIIDGNISPLLNSSSSDDQNYDQPQTEIFWHDALAWQYKTYEVTKIKKYGSKQERVLGIDKERITNMSPKEQETKRPARLVKDVVKIALVDQKPKTFTIEYVDSKTYIYEAKSHALAVEIVGKVAYIIGKK